MWYFIYKRLEVGIIITMLQEFGTNTYPQLIFETVASETQLAIKENCCFRKLQLHDYASCAKSKNVVLVKKICGRWLKFIQVSAPTAFIVRIVTQL